MIPGKTVAIVSVGGEFPDSPTLDRYWQNIVNNVNTARTPPADRWLLPLEQVYSPQVGAADRVYSQKACFLAAQSDSDQIPESAIDSEYFNTLDPMFRLLLRVGRQTLADIKLDDRIRARAGVIIGNLALPSEKSSALARHLLGQTFLESLDNPSLSLPEEPVAPDNRYVAGLPAALLGQAFGFQGSCYSIDAACASSLYAIKLAVDELLSGQTDLMLAGGLSRPDSLYTQMGFSQLRALSPTGTCSPFATTADGLVVGEGCGLVVLKRTEDAVRDGDDILAVIRGIGLSNDLAGNLLAPASEGQLRAMRAAYQQAGWDVDEVDLIECHATGTPVGDAVEFNSLRSLWNDSTWHPGQCVIGSVKANIGHLLTAAGSAALIKVLLAIKHRLLPPMANFNSPAAGIELADSPFRVLKQAARWERRSAEQPRRAAVSAFGFGGINAHLLLEEWRPQVSRKQRSLTSHPSFSKKPEPVAIVGMGTHFGSWPDLAAFSRRVFADSTQVQPHAPHHWWGVENSRWLQQQGLPPETFQGHYLQAVTAVPGEFKIPPLELAEMLPRQLLMLQVAAAALDDAGLKESDQLFTGVFIGCGLDLNATNFSFRWGMRNYAEWWAQELGLDLAPAALASWVQQLRESCGPALTANRTMGALGSVVASRIAKEYQIGGPSFTLSSEENSGLRALEVGVKALLEGSINRALVGAVDLAGDLRNLISREQAKRAALRTAQLPFVHQVEDRVIGEGAAALVLKRLADAKQDGDRIYAVIKGMGTAQSAAPEPTAAAAARTLSLARSCAAARVEPASIGYLETEDRVAGDFDGREKNPLPISSNREAIGYPGGAAGLAGVVKSALSLYHRILPTSSSAPRAEAAAGVTPAQYWLTDRGEQRRALIAATGGDGSCSQILLEEAPATKTAAAGLLSARPTGALPEALFVMEGNDSEALLATVERLEDFAQRNPELDCDSLAAAWLEHQPLNPQLERACALIVDKRADLADYLAAARRKIARQSGAESAQKQPLDSDPRLRERLFYSSAPLARQGKVAFMFPGSGNHYAGMGRELLSHWPQVLRQQETTSDQLASQYQPHEFWGDSLSKAIRQDHNALVISHVALCTAISDLLRQFAVEPRMVCGYSLGESAGLFATRAWRDRDGMLRRLRQSSLFTRDLAGECRAARRVWGLPASEQVDWLLGMVNLPEDQVRQALRGRKRVYLLIVNTYRETVIGGQRQQVEQLVADLGCHFIPLEGVTTVHCEVVKAVADAYRELHLFPTQAPSGIDFYSCARAAKYPVTSGNAADTILQQALARIDYPRTVEQLYADGARIFIEAGPGASCSRMISSILGDRPHLARSICQPGQAESSQLLRLLGACLAERVPVDLRPLYPQRPAFAEAQPNSRQIAPMIGGQPFKPPLPPQSPRADKTTFPAQETAANQAEPTAGVTPSKPLLSPTADAETGHMGAALRAQQAAHQSYLTYADSMQQAMAGVVEHQLALVQQLIDNGESVNWAEMAAASEARVSPSPEPLQHPEVGFDRAMCLEFAIGSVAKVLGPEYAEVDHYPTRVRLPDEPLMLVDRILQVEGEARSMSHGRVVTEHDVSADRWYLDGGRIPTCIAVEAGQADLFLSGYLGIDFITKGHAVYRLLDAAVTFHRSLPVVGDTIRYEIEIERFFKQDQTYLFHFNFESSVAGEPLLSMHNGCAGFFSAGELAAGQGIVHTKLDQRPQPGKIPDDWRELAPMQAESYTDKQIEALYAGDLVTAFGPRFAGLPLTKPYTLPGGKLKLVDRVIALDPQGGRYGCGQITAEMDIRPDDWFLTCHFVDDRVMPGTLMYECCLHTLRIYLLRMGWIGEAGQTWCEPVPGISSGLKCRGQVTEQTSTVTYQVAIKELGYRPAPFAIVDALMFADGKAIVEIPDMTVQLAGLKREQVEALWRGADTRQNPSRQILFDTDRITAFAIGKPSEAFGAPYRVFDEQRRIARLPGPPFQFLDRIVAIGGEPWKLVADVSITAEYDVPPDAWYFSAGRQSQMPFSVLLEIALQPCGWLAAYLGSALTSEVDLSFRNLDGKAVQYRPVAAASGTLTTDVTLTKVAGSGGMLIQNYSFSVRDAEGPVYRGDTVFGFFTRESLAQQVGIRGAPSYIPDAAEQARAETFSYPRSAPFPAARLRMVDEIDWYIATGGPHGLGLIRGSKQVNPEEWFFQAHFYQDPVWPGSLGLESFLQLLKVVAAQRWPVSESTRFETVTLGNEHHWSYRGQIVPENQRVTVDAVITAVDDQQKWLQADGLLSVDGKVIYRISDFTLNLG